MRSRVLLSAVGVAATASLVTTVVLVAAPSASAVGQHRIAVTEKDNFTSQDLGRKGLSVGDHLVYSAVLRKSGKKVGGGGGDCVLLSGTTDKTALYHCLGTYRFGAATLTAQGFFDTGSNGEQRWAITGGTGRYAGAHGVYEFKALSADTFAGVFQFTT